MTVEQTKSEPDPRQKATQDVTSSLLFLSYPLEFSQEFNSLTAVTMSRRTNTNSDHNVIGAQSHEETAVIIVGAGPVGLLLAVLLAKKNISSVVLEQADGVDTSPRAVVHYPPVLEIFKTAGIYETVIERGMILWGAQWRGSLVDDENGNKLLGPVIAKLSTGVRNPDGGMPESGFVTAFAQGYLTALLLDEARKTGLVRIIFLAKFSSFVQHPTHIQAAFTTKDGPQSLQAQYLVGCDGARSGVRKAANIAFSGHSWPDRLLAVDLERVVPVIGDLPAYYAVDRKYWGVIVPLKKVVAGEPGLWRFAMAVSDSTLSDEEVASEEFAEELLSHFIDGPRPSKHKIIKSRAYRTQQVLASTMHRGRVLLAGDAAHLNNPIGGLGLCTGLLDVDLLHQTLDLIFNNSYHEPQSLLAEYSAARRFVFANVVNPITTANRFRLYESDPETAAREDWYFRALRRENPEELQNMGKSFFQVWKSDVNELTRKVQLGGQV